MFYYSPNYTSLYAPQDPIVTTLTYQIQYQYSATLLWAVYGTAISITTLAVIIGIWVMLKNEASYSSKFSTFLRVSHNLGLSKPLTLEDTSGKDPLPPHLKRIEVEFPPNSVTSGYSIPAQQGILEERKHMTSVQLIMENNENLHDGS